MKRVIQRTKRFEKSFVRLSKKVQVRFLEKLELFLEDEYHILLKTHQLKGKRRNSFAFSVTGDIRAIYAKKMEDNKTILIFTFIDIGTHNRVYR